MMIKDEARQERLNQVYGHLFAHFGIKSQVQFAEALHVQRTALSAAMNGNKAYLTKNLFIKICAAWPGVFNLDYLLTGEGELLINGEQKQKEMPPSEQAANILEIYANRIRLLDDMRTSLSEELAEIRMIKEELTQARDDFRQATARLSDTLHLLNIATPLTATDASGVTIGKASIAAAPFKRNRSTDYSGPLFGTSGETSVMLNNEWSEPYVGEW